MANDLRSYPVPSLVQGVSQQSTITRRDSQHEYQLNCVNSPVDGIIPRPHITFKRKHEADDLTGAFLYGIERASEEIYLLAVRDGALKLFDVRNYGDVDLVVSADTDYLTTVGDPRDALTATTLEDTTFVLNKERTPQMDGVTLSPAALNAGLVFCRAGNYLTKYRVAITYEGTVYRWQYTTPDNSSSANAAFITTANIMSSFFKAMTGVSGTEAVDTPVAVDPTYGTGVGNGYSGGSGNGPTGVTLATLGFQAKLNGSTMLIWRDDDKDWGLDASDGAGDQYLKVVRTGVQAFADLPRNAFIGYVAKVKGESLTADDDYFVTFTGGTGQGGYWEETVAPNAKVSLLPGTMPHRLTNTALNSFEFDQPPWGDRVAGDGVETAKDPSFIGKRVLDIGYHSNRLVLLTEGAATWSKSQNPYVFFPDSVQTTLAEDRIDYKIGGGKSIALLRKIVQHGEGLFLWAPKVQFRVSSGTDPFKQDTVEAKPAASWNFSDKCNPLALGDELVFATELGNYAALRSLRVVNERFAGTSDLTQHVSRYVPAGLRIIAGNSALGIMTVQTDGDPSALYVYNFMYRGDGPQAERVQAAWNRWQLPPGSTVLWHTFNDNVLILALQRDDGVVFAEMDLSVGAADVGFSYAIRLDMRVDEGDVLLAYSSGTDLTTIALPYSLTEGERQKLKVVQRTSIGDKPRGTEWEVVSSTPSSVTVKGDAFGAEFYVGLTYDTITELSEFALRQDSGAALIVDDLRVHDVTVQLDRTSYTRMEAIPKVGKTSIQRFEGRTFGEPENQTDGLVLASGPAVLPVNQSARNVRIRLINDSWAPSRWVSVNYTYTVTNQAVTPRR